MEFNGKEMYNLAKRLFPICRSITGDGVRETLKVIQGVFPDLKIYEVPSGTEAFDWEVPKEWNIRDAYIEDSNGNKIVDFKENNLHVIGYSAPVDKFVSLNELKPMIYTQVNQPEVIPYVTSYYKSAYGFCMSENQKNSLKEDQYHIVIDSELKDGFLTYGEILIPGESQEEIFLSTYICHPSMANNELSGPCMLTYLAKWLYSLARRRYSYRIIFIPETIGSIVYISKNLQTLKQRMIAGFNVSCVGDNRTFSYVASRSGDTLADRVAKNVLSFYYPQYVSYSFLSRGSDERQYCSPGVDLPVCVICRSKYGVYPEYHTSADNLDLISPDGLYGAFEVYRQCIGALENNYKYQVECLCEPQLGKRGLYPNISKKDAYAGIREMMNFLAYADGKHDLIEISDKIRTSIHQLLPIIKVLEENGLLCKQEG